MSRRVRWQWRLVAAAVPILIIGGVAISLRVAQVDSRESVADRFVAKAAIGASFVSTYVAHLVARETSIASSTVGGSNPTAAFNSDIAAFGFSAGVLLDARGRVISIVPSDPSLIGASLVSRYAHLASAENGTPAVSDVVTSAVTRAAVVAFAVPFATTAGRRVFSGAYAVADTPLPAFLKDSTTLPGAQVYLIDAGGIVVAANDEAANSASTLATLDPHLNQASEANASGFYRSSTRSMYFAEVKVAGTPWSLLMAAPSTALFAQVEGTSHWVPWALLAGLAILAGLASWLTLRLIAGRRELIEIARTDPMTGLLTRRYISEKLDTALVDADRYGLPVSVLMIDIDHFKQINDTYGHRAGDQAIKHIAERLAASLRGGDMMGRWGGEEFLAVLPHTALDAATAAAERLRAMLAASPIEIGSSREIVIIQTSVGVAEHTGGPTETLIHRADLALYEAKAAGRNVVRSAV